MRNLGDKIKKYTFGELVQIFDYRYGLGRLETLFSTNWFNPFKTIWLNFRCFPLSQAWKFPVFVYGRPQFFCLSGSMKVIGRINPGMIKFNKVMSAGPSLMNLQTQIVHRGEILFRGKGLIGTGNKIVTACRKTIDFGANFKVCDCNNISCYYGIKIGGQTRITHRCQILDTNFHYVANFTDGVIPPHGRPIKIGNGCWICNSSSVVSGSILPNYTIVASHSLVNKDMSSIPESSLIGGVPAKFISTGFRKIENSNIESIVSNHYDNISTDMFCIDNKFTMEECSFVDYFK